MKNVGKAAITGKNKMIMIYAFPETDPFHRPAEKKMDN
jgi:hypothetical protein